MFDYQSFLTNFQRMQDIKSGLMKASCSLFEENLSVLFSYGTLIKIQNT